MNSTVLAVLEAVTVVSSIGLLFSLIPTYYHICKAKTTGDYSILPAATIWFSCSMWVLYGCLVGNFVPLVTVDSCGATLGVVFSAVFYKYASDRSYVRKVCLILGAIELVVVAYVVIGLAGVTRQTQDQVSTALGFVTAGTDIVMYSSPLATLRHVLTVKDASSIPLAMSVVGLINTALWVTVSTDDLFLAIPNGLGCAFSVIGIVVYFIYRPRRLNGASKEGQIKHDASLDEINIRTSRSNYSQARTPVETQEMHWNNQDRRRHT